jgi:hypothetical protein
MTKYEDNKVTPNEVSILDDQVMAMVGPDGNLHIRRFADPVNARWVSRRVKEFGDYVKTQKPETSAGSGARRAAKKAADKKTRARKAA